jgi:hypothetical protein
MFSTKGALTRRSLGIFLGILVLAATALVLYSQTRAFVWDEGFHLVAAALIAQGKTPYIDFCFPQTPLNAYWNAVLISLFGQDWHMPHLLAALFAVGAMVLAAEFVLARMPAPQWRLAGAASAAVLVGLNTTVMQFGTIAQAYGSAMFFSVAAFRVAIAAAARRPPWLGFTAGCLAGVAAGCSLLTAPVAAVLLVWSFWNERGSGRWARAGAFAAGAAIPFAPVAWLFIRAPRQVFFNIIEYQALFRRVKWTGATLHDIEALSAWVDSTQALALAMLGIAGPIAVLKRREWSAEVRAEFQLAGWLSAGLGVFIAVAHPTFQRYFIFLVPFASMLAAVGLYSVGSKLLGDRPGWAAAAVVALMTLTSARAQFENRDETTWHDYEEVARKTAEVTPAGGMLYVEEPVYFILRRNPPSGLEFSYARSLQLPLEQEKLLHIVSQGEIKEQIRAGRFATVQSCKDDLIDDYGLAKSFPHQAEVQDCSIFWGKVKAGP